MKHPYNINIEFFDVGAAVNVGCKRLAYTDLQQMLVDLSAYVNNPEATIKVMQEQYPSLKPEPFPRLEALEEAADPPLLGILGQNNESSHWNR